MKLTKRRTDLGNFAPRPARVSLIGQTYLIPNDAGSTVINRTRGVQTGGVKARRPFVVVRINTKNAKRIRDFHQFCDSRGLVLYPLEFTPDELAAMPVAFHDRETGDGLEVSAKPRLCAHIWEVCGPALALLSLRAHRSVVEWFNPRRGVMPNPKGSGQSKQ